VKIDKKELDKNRLEITVRVDRETAQPWLKHAAEHLSTHKAIAGFRPGKAPYEIVKREFGEAAIISEALEDIINGTFNQILDNENIRTYGKIDFDLKPVLDANEIAVYTATMTLMPKITLGKWQETKLKRSEIKVTDEELSKALDELAVMTSAENPVERPAQNGDKAMVDFEVSVDGKVIEGGTAKDFGLVLGEGRMIPGFEEKIIGAKAGDKLEFELKFPDDYSADHLKAKPAHFKVTLNQVIERVKPQINDEFAKRVGVENAEKLKERIRDNIKKEKEQQEEERVEIAAIKHVTDTSSYESLPQSMIEDAVSDLVHEFEHNLAHQGMKFEQYLTTAKKTVEQLRKEFEPKAENRIKSSMALGQLAEEQKLSISGEEIDKELKIQEQTYANNPQALNDVRQPEYRRHVANSLINRKIIKFIKDKIVE
jgi:trigger factor